MSGKVVHVDFAAWGASEPQQRTVCGLRGYVLRDAEARAAHAAALQGTALLPLVTILSRVTSTPAETTLPGLSAWLLSQRSGVQRT